MHFLYFILFVAFLFFFLRGGSLVKGEFFLLPLKICYLELLLVVLSRLPLSKGTTFDFSFCADLML
jgi:hypothetical protein